MKSILSVIAIAMLGLALNWGAAAAHQSDEEPQPANVSIADLKDSDGTVLGYVVVMQDDAGATGIAVVARGLPPGTHGIHIHETGNCDPSGEKTFEKAGAHFNPGHMPHPFHGGDLGNLVADEEGEVVFSAFKTGFTIGEAGPVLNDLDGSALVIHAEVDDLATDPSGNSGARIACAVLFPPR